ncbi:MAG: peroxiredoxin [Rhodobacteraceae bacterium]|nr:peroxiredoxin [Paracoccaceae bacterium]
MTDKLETAPTFSLPATQDGEISSDALQGQAYVLFFYPRDDTSGCTKESIAFTGLKPDFDALGVKVIGVSKDSMAKHEKFAAKHALGIPLISDETGTLCEDFGVWKEKSMYGKTYMGIERSTFLIDGTGAIVRAWRKVKVPGHAEEVLDAAKAL